MKILSPIFYVFPFLFWFRLFVFQVLQSIFVVPQACLLLLSIVGNFLHFWILARHKTNLIWNENRVKPPSKIWYHLVNISLQINIKSLDKIGYFCFCLFCYIVRQTMSSNEQSLVQAGWAGFSGVKSISWCWCGIKHKIDIPLSLLIWVFYLHYVNMLQIIMEVRTHAT